MFNLQYGRINGGFLQRAMCIYLGGLNLAIQAYLSGALMLNNCLWQIKLCSETKRVEGGSGTMQTS